jgi:hypothetical protein
MPYFFDSFLKDNRVPIVRVMDLTFEVRDCLYQASILSSITSTDYRKYCPHLKP